MRMFTEYCREGAGWACDVPYDITGRYHKAGELGSLEIHLETEVGEMLILHADYWLVFRQMSLRALLESEI